jgi:hypothetical protein
VNRYFFFFLLFINRLKLRVIAFTLLVLSKHIGVFIAPEEYTILIFVMLTSAFRTDGFRHNGILNYSLGVVNCISV